MIVEPTFQSWQCASERIFLRADLNIPLQKTTIVSDGRLQAIQPTLNYLLKKNAQIILATHIGRPTTIDPLLSTQLLIPWFKKHGYTIEYAESPTAVMHLPLRPNTIILLENLRFFPGEKSKSSTFARELAQLAPWYVNDAFGALHRDDTSLTLLAEHYKASHRSIGFLIEKELTILSTILQKPARPITFILGGGKVADKLPLIDHLINVADTIILLPALVFTFLKAEGIGVGTSLIDKEALTHIPSVLKQMETKKIKVVFPHDYQIGQPDQEGSLSYVDAHTIPANGMGISIGPKSINQIKKIIQNSATIFYNGMMGFPQRKETMTGMNAIIQAMAASSATTIVAGGDSIAVVDHLGITTITHCITGGGSAVTYLSNQPLPGLQPFLKNRTKTN